MYPEESSGSVDTDDQCDSCKRIRVVAGHAGELMIHLTSDDQRLRIVLPFVPAPSSGAPITVRAGEEILVLVVGAVVPAPFELTTTLTVASSR